MNSTEGIFTLSQTNSVGSWQGTSDGYYVPNTGSSQREAEAKEFINFITGPYYQTYINNQKEEPLLSGAHAPSRHSRCLCEGVPPFQDQLCAAVPTGLESGIQQHLPQLDRRHDGR